MKGMHSNVVKPIEPTVVEGTYQIRDVQYIVLMGEVAITSLEGPVSRLSTPGVQSCVALAMLHKEKQIAVLGHFDSPANVEPTMNQIIEILKKEYHLSPEDLKGFEAKLFGGIKKEGWVGKMQNTNCITDPIQERLKPHGIEPEYKDFDNGAYGSNFNLCVDVFPTGIQVMGDSNLQYSVGYTEQATPAQQENCKKRMGNNNPRWGNLPYDISTLEAKNKKTSYHLEMNKEQYQAWRVENNAPCCSCTIL